VKPQANGEAYTLGTHRNTGVGEPKLEPTGRVGSERWWDSWLENAHALDGASIISAERSPTGRQTSADEHQQRR